MTVVDMGKRAKGTMPFLSQVTAEQKNSALLAIADALENKKDDIIEANKIDMLAGEKAGLNSGLLDRLLLDSDRIDGIASAVRDVAALDDPCGKTVSEYHKDNGLIIKKVTVPMGVIGIIFEARPNVTADAAALCLKSGNAVILRGGKEAINSNTAIADIMRDAVESAGFPKDVIQLVQDTSRRSSTDLMHLDKYLDDAYLAHLPSVRIVHGKGTGALRNAVQAHLRKQKYVKEFHAGAASEGDAGVTIATFE